jgi:hypothetical protein
MKLFGDNSGRQAARAGLHIPVAILLTAFLVVPASALDLSADFGVATSGWFRYANAVGPRLNTTISLGQPLGEVVYLVADFWNSAEMGASASQWLQPRELDCSLTADFWLDPLSLGVYGTIYAPVAAPTRGDLGAYLSASLPVVGEILAIDGGLRCVTDFAGVYGELRLGPSALLPLDLPLDIGVQARLGAMAGNYGGQAWTGLTTLYLQPKATLHFDRSFRLSALGGYSFDLSGGRFPAYAFGALEFGVSLSTPEPAAPELPDLPAGGGESGDAAEAP